jgi:hypothetical protein
MEATTPNQKPTALPRSLNLTVHLDPQFISKSLNLSTERLNTMVRKEQSEVMDWRHSFGKDRKYLKG